MQAAGKRRQALPWPSQNPLGSLSASSHEVLPKCHTESVNLPQTARAKQTFTETREHFLPPPQSGRERETRKAGLHHHLPGGLSPPHK